MKNLTSLIFLCIYSTIYAQVPEGINYQAVDNMAPYMVNLYENSQGPSGLKDKRQFDDSGLNKILVNAVQEQQVQIEVLKKEMEEMKLIIKALNKD
jgi:hypothetical protein